MPGRLLAQALVLVPNQEPGYFLRLLLAFRSQKNRLRERGVQVRLEEARALLAAETVQLLVEVVVVQIQQVAVW